MSWPTLRQLVVLTALSVGTVFPSAASALAPDKSFGDRGAAMVDGRALQQQAAVINVSRGFLVWGVDRSPSTFGSLDASKLTRSGRVDRRFGSSGWMSFRVRGEGRLWARNGVRAANGRAVLAAEFERDGDSADERSVAAIWMLNRAGTVDKSFGRSGRVLSSLNCSGSRTVTNVHAASDRLLVTGTCDGVPVVAAVKYDGSMDRKFGTNGVVSAATPARVGDSAMRGSRLLIAVASSVDGQRKVEVLEINAETGAFETSFGIAGSAVVATGPTPLSADGIAIAPDGTIVVAIGLENESQLYKLDATGLSVAPFGSPLADTFLHDIKRTTDGWIVAGELLKYRIGGADDELDARGLVQKIGESGAQVKSDRFVAKRPLAFDSLLMWDGRVLAVGFDETDVVAWLLKP